MKEATGAHASSETHWELSHCAHCSSQHSPQCCTHIDGSSSRQPSTFTRHSCWIHTVVVLFVLSNIPSTNAQGLTTTLKPTPGDMPENVPWDDFMQENVMPKVVTMIVIFAGAILIGMLVAKLVEYCHERRSINDNASDMSDYTRQLLKAQLMLAFSKGKKKKKGNPDDFAKKYGKIWQGKVIRNKARKIKAEKDKSVDGKEKDVDSKKTPNKQDKKGTNKQNATKSSTSNKNVPKPSAAANGASVTPAGPKVTLTVVDETNNTSSAKPASITPPVTASHDLGAQTTTSSQGSPARIAPSPTKVATPKATVKKTNVGSRPVSAGLKKHGITRPATAKSRPGTAKGVPATTKTVKNNAT